jgi:hypothetical protein
MHIEQDLVESKIAILRESGHENNRAILNVLANEGPLIKYDLFKAIKKSRGISQKTVYSTISRRVDDLASKGFLVIAGKKPIIVGKRHDESSSFGLTWKGVIAGLCLQPVSEKIFRVFEKNSYLLRDFPEETWGIVTAVFTEEELRDFVGAFLVGFLSSIPGDLSLVDSKHLAAYIIPAVAQMPNLQSSFEGKDFSHLLEIPEVEMFTQKMLAQAEGYLEASLASVRELGKSLRENAPAQNLKTIPSEAVKKEVYSD